MAIAPVNKFINIAVPVAPGVQKLYEVPTGTSALLLYAQVSNVAVGTTYPTTTFWQRRTQRSTGSTRDVRVIKSAEIPPQDALIMVDGRIVLEKTPLVVDSLFIRGTQQGVGIITDVQYDEPSGIATVHTEIKHGFSAGDQISMGGMYFTCASYSGITTNIFPDPQRSYTIDQIQGNVGTSKTFSIDIGGAGGNAHTYNSAIHRFVRAATECVEVVASSNYTAGDKLNVSNASYEGSTGELVLTLGANNLQANDTIKIADNSLVFTCTMDNNYSEHSYPRSTDPASNTPLTLAIAVANESIRVQVGKSSAGGFVAPLEMELTASILENSNV